MAAPDLSPRQPMPLDLSECEREPIHIPGAIQPHGMLFAVDHGAGHVVVQVSANAGLQLGVRPARVLGASLLERFDEACRGSLEGALLASSRSRQGRVGLTVGGSPWTGLVHDNGDVVIVEAERSEEPPPDDVAREQAALRELMTNLLAAESVGALHELLPHGLRRLTGYERVMLYLFDDTGAGEVVAEARDPELEPYLGLRYPASDIPAQARRLYVIERTRLIVDANYEPVPIVPELHPATGAALDLSHATLRSVSPVHCAYLANMGVRGSMSISLVDGDHLFGLIACHHRSPRWLRFELREACEWVGRIASFVYATHAREETGRRAGSARRTLTELCVALGPHERIGQALADVGDTICELVGASGAIVHSEEETHLFGRTPPRDVAEGLVAWLGDVMHGGVFTTSRLPSEYAPAAPHRDTACGVLAAPLAAEGLVAWLRPEVVRTVSWAGDPHHPAKREEDGRIGPRRSFALWQEEVREQAAPFEAWQLEVAKTLERIARAVAVRRAAAPRPGQPRAARRRGGP